MGCYIESQIAQHAEALGQETDFESYREACLKEMVDRLINGEEITLTDGRTLDRNDVAYYAYDLEAFHKATKMMIGAVNSAYYREKAFKQMKTVIEQAARELAEDNVDQYALIGGVV